MARSSTLLAYVRPSEHRRAWLRQEAEAAACEVHFADTLQAAVLGLAARRPAAMIADVEEPDCEAVCDAVRSKRREVDIAVFGVADQLDTEVFAASLRRGVDDMVAFHADGALCARVVSLPADPSLPPPLQGDALVALSEPTRTARVSRVLTNAGYEVDYAGDVGGLGNLTLLKRVRLVLADARVGDLRARIQQSRAAGSRAVWVLLASADELPSLEERTRGLDRVAVISDAELPDSILCVSNEVAAARRREFRIEPRLLHGALVAFRSAGSRTDDFGFTYNLSPTGLYVRTLAPPLESLVWLELCPPGSRHRIRLEGEVAWRRAFGRFGTATAPPGFGARIVGGLAGDQEAWVKGCQRLQESRRTGKPLEFSSSEPPGITSLEPAKSEPAATRETETSPAASFAEVSEPTPSADSSEPISAAAGVVPPAKTLPVPATDMAELPEADRPPPSHGASQPTSKLTWTLVIGIGLLAGWFGARAVGFLAAPSAPRPAHTLPRATRAAERPSSHAPPLAKSQSAQPRGSVGRKLGPASPQSAAPAPLPPPSVSQSSPPAELPNAASLPANEGYLRVTSSLDTRVFVLAADAGKTNTWLRVPCGWRWIRLGRALGLWQSEGRSVYLLCRKTNELTLEPTP